MILVRSVKKTSSKYKPSWSPKIFCRTIQDCTLSIVYMFWMYTVHTAQSWSPCRGLIIVFYIHGPLPPHSLSFRNNYGNPRIDKKPHDPDSGSDIEIMYSLPPPHLINRREKLSTRHNISKRYIRLGISVADPDPGSEIRCCTNFQIPYPS